MAVATVLAVTLGAGALAVPAFAEPGGGGAVAGVAGDDAELVRYPEGGALAGAGVSGFLTHAADDTSTFRRYADGVGRVFGYGAELRSTRATDFVVVWEPGKVTQHDLGTDGVMEVAVGEASGEPRYAGSAGDAVFTTLADGAGTELRRHTAAHPGGTVVAGLPAGAVGVEVEAATPEHASVMFAQGGERKWGVLDLAAGTVTGVRAYALGDKAVSSTRTAWVEGEETNLPPRVYVSDRGTGAVQQVPGITEPTFGSFHVGLVGNWVVYGQSGGMAQSRAGVHYPLTAYSFAAKSSVKLLDHAYQVTAGPDGSLYVRGGVVGQGEGLYRVTDPGGGAEPQVVKVATTGAPTEIVATPVTVPGAVLDLDRNDHFGFRFRLSRTTRDVTLAVRHVRTGKTTTVEALSSDTDVRLSWGTYAWSEAPRNGDYTWQLTATPDNGIGPAAVLTGAFKVVRAAQPHDFNDNGSPDLLTRDGSGQLWRHDLFYRDGDERSHQGEPRALIGSGWSVYDRIEAAGNLGGSAVGDLLARDKAGVLWLYQGNGSGNFATRVKVGGGWQIYDKITAGSDLTGDGRTDALATDTSGALWLYPGTGDAEAPFTVRQRIGGGWAAYNDITATGDLAGGPAGDLVARDKAGVLWLYLGKGDGTFAPRTRIGSGWNAYSALIGAGDTDGDGRPDLIGIGAGHNPPMLYKGTGEWKSPFRSGALMHLDTDITRASLVL
ncbi:FG-GAP repeat domain-containing protein [Streptomyces sp. NPDC085479]|uniref:FG-GAP repeat domain-containing protein n=1 Tax=Streptomyces sp. NPDC085479 TaxID=3365726 RepID=UPI0037D8C5A2